MGTLNQILPHQSVLSASELRWPLEMVAATAAAFYDTTRQKFIAGVRRGEYPAPTSVRGKKRERLWYRPALEAHAAERHGFLNQSVEDATCDVADLI